MPDLSFEFEILNLAITCRVFIHNSHFDNLLYLAIVGKWLDGAKLDEIPGTAKLILTNIPNLYLNKTF